MKYMKRTAALLAVMLMLTGCGSVTAETSAETTDTAAKSVSAENNAYNGEYIYCVGSVSKIYSTAAVMQLVDEGKVGLDTPITEYIPDFTMADERYKDITVRMLMDHTSGIMGSTMILIITTICLKTLLLSGLKPNRASMRHTAMTVLVCWN